VRLAEVACDLLFGRAPLLVPHDHHAAPLVPGEAADDRRVVPEATVAVELLPLGEERFDVIERVRPVRVARELDLLPGAEVGEELAGDARGLVFQATELPLERTVALGELAQLAHTGDQVDDGLFEGENERCHGGNRGKPSTEARGSRRGVRLGATDVRRGVTRVDFTVIDVRRDATRVHFIVIDVRRDVTGVDFIVIDVRHGVTGVHFIATDVRHHVTESISS
jgi:hypothetical protein